MLPIFDIVGKLGGVVLDKMFPNKDKALEAKRESNMNQSRINEAEVSGGPASYLRLWRSFLGWVCAALFTWECVRGVIVFYMPEAHLPPSMAKEVMHLLLVMLGASF